MSDTKVKTLAQVAVLLIIAGGVLAFWLSRSGYDQPGGERFPITFTVSEDGRSLADDNGLSVQIPDQWVAEPAMAQGQEVPNAYDLHHERADVICNIEVAHGKNVTGTSATGFVSVYDSGNQATGRFKDSFQRLETFDGTSFQYASIGWTGEDSNIRHRQAYLPYRGYLLTVRFTEDLTPDRLNRQPLACITLYNNMLESGITLP